MDYSKIGNFIAAERKAKQLTQKKLAEKLFVSEKTVSKWETGNGLPDTSSLPNLCDILNISINELLNGERISAEEYAVKAEDKMLAMHKAKEQADKHLLTMEIVIGVLSVSMCLILTFIASFLDMKTWLRIVLIVVGFIAAIVGAGFALKIEQVAGFYKCGNCGNKYVPTYKQVVLAAHVDRTRRMKCPLCHKHSWHNKVID